MVVQGVSSDLKTPDTIDPAGKDHRTFYDSLGRTTKTVANFTGSGEISAATPDQNVTVEMAYHSSGQLSKFIAKNPVTGDQITSYVYGTGKAAIAPLVHRNDLLTAEIYPESDDFENSQNILHNGGDGVVDRVEFQYNRAGERVWKRDQNGTIHHYEYDNLGRLLRDRVTTLASGIDASVRKIATAYDLIGNVKSVTSFNLSGGVLDQIMYEYDECGLLCREFHAADGLVDFAVSPCITYTYDKIKDGDLFLKNFRTISVTYPSGRVIGYEYGTANSDADRLNRCTAIKDGAVTLATYTHLGVSSPMKVTYNQPGLVLDYTASGALDRFGRVTEHAWKKGATNIARINHGYNRLGNRLYREDGVGVSRDELYSYDESNQLLGMERGKLNATKNAVANKNFAENFVFDATGNWLTYERDDNGDQIWDLSQTRTHNKANEITCLDSSHTNIAHDRNGNTVKMPKPNDWNAAYTCVYDAWNRLVQVKDGNTVVATYEYNGLNQRIKKTVGTIVTDSVFNHNWQELESKTGTEVTTYAWGLRYIDDLICRDKVSERLFALQDANWNVVAITDTNGVVKERIAYDAFGKPRWLDVNHGPKTTSGYAWNRTFTGQVYDSETGLMLYRNRFYHPGLGRFARRDPLKYIANDRNVFRYVNNSPIIEKDKYGLAITLETGNDSYSPVNNYLHQNVCVDTWSGCGTECPKKRKKRCFSFASDLTLGVWVGKTWLGKNSLKACGLTGYVYEPDPVLDALISGVKKTTCQEDKAFLKKMLAMVGMQDGYSVGRHNCRLFSSTFFEEAPGVEMKWVCLSYEYVCYAGSGGFAGCVKVCKYGEWRPAK